MLLADEVWAYRFPKAAEMGPRLRAEHAVLPRLQHLPLSVPLPERFAEPRGDRALPLLGYRVLPGEPVDVVRPASPRPLLEQLWAFLDALHASPREAPFTAAAAATTGLPDGGAIRSPHPAAEAVLRFLDARSPPPVPPSLCHNDVGMCHVLMDRERGVLTGVIDWGDMTWADPAVDWVGVIWAFPDALEATKGRTAPDTVARAWLHALRFALLDCLDVWEGGALSPAAQEGMWQRLRQKLARAQRSPVF